MSTRAPRNPAWAEAAAGIIAVAIVAVVGHSRVELARQTPELAIEAPPALAGDLAATAVIPSDYVASPRRVRNHLSVLLDGKQLALWTTDLPGDGERFGFGIDTASELGPGFHLLEFRPGYGQPDPRSAALGLVGGRSADANGWARRGVQVIVAEEALRRLEAPLARSIEQSVATQLGAHPEDRPPTVNARVTLHWVERGLRVGAVVMVDGTEASFATDLAIGVDSAHRLSLRRDGELVTSIRGKLIRKSRLMAAAGGAGAGAFFGPWGALGGAIAGLFGGGRVVEGKARSKLTALVDQEVASLEGLLSQQLAVSLDEATPGATLEIRVSGAPRIEAGHSLHVDFDVRMRLVSGTGDAMGPLADEVVPEAPEPTSAQPITLTVSTDAFNRILHGLWRSGSLDRMMQDPGLMKRVQGALDDTVFTIESVRLKAPPVVESGAANEMRVIVPRLEVRLCERDKRTETIALFSAVAPITTSIDRGAQMVRFWTTSPRLWSTCRRDTEVGRVVYTPCLSELMDLSRQKLESAAGRRQPLLSLPTQALLPLGGNKDDRGSFRVGISDLGVRLPRDKARESGITVWIDPRVD